LLGRLDDAETEAVLGHELTHVRNGDVRMMVIAVVIAGVIAFFAELLFRMWFNTGFGWRSRRSDNGDSSDRGKGGAGAALLIAAVLIALAWLLSALIRFALSRSREFLADAGSVELTKNPDAMISALRKIEGRGELPGATSAVMEMCVDNPRSGFADLFATHPSIDSRVEALVKYAGGHDPGPIALPPPEDAAPPEEAAPSEESAPSEDAAPRPAPAPENPAAPYPGPWSSGADASSNTPPTPPLPGPWGPHR
jgi:heat shock protein HtpX